MVSPPSTEIKLIGAGRRLTLWVGYYLIALFAIVAFLTGSVAAALFLIVISEILLLFWRPTPSLETGSYNDPTPAGWQAAIRVMRWYELLKGCWSAAAVAVVSTVVIGIIIVSIATHNRPIGAANYAVLVLFGAWLLTRQRWSPPLMRTIRKSMQGVQKELSRGSPLVRVGTDGIDIDLHMTTIGSAPKRSGSVFSVGFAELSEVRTLGPNEAQAYWQSMQQYDPTVTARAGWELYKFVAGKVARPYIFEQLAFGTHLLVRGPTVLYLIGNSDESGPAAVAAWQAWQARQAALAVPQ